MFVFDTYSIIIYHLYITDSEINKYSLSSYVSYNIGQYAGQELVFFSVNSYHENICCNGISVVKKDWLLKVLTGIKRVF